MDNVNRLKEAIRLIKEKNEADAKQLLLELVQDEPTNSLAWMWLAACAETNEEKISYLEKVLEIDPENEKARQSLELLAPPPETEQQDDDELEVQDEPDELGEPSLDEIVVPQESISDASFLTAFWNKWRWYIIGTIISLAVLVAAFVTLFSIPEVKEGTAFLLGLNTPTPTHTSTPTKTGTPTRTSTNTLTFTPTNTPTATITPTPSDTPTITKTPTKTLTPTRTLTFTPTNTATPYQIILPTEVRTTDGWLFTITDVILKTDIGSAKPEEDYFLVILMDAANNTGKKDCLKIDQFGISIGLVNIPLDRKHLDDAKSKYSRDYPGQFLGQCINNGETERSLLIFDIPATTSNMDLELRDQKARLGNVPTLIQITTE